MILPEQVAPILRNAVGGTLPGQTFDISPAKLEGKCPGDGDHMWIRKNKNKDQVQTTFTCSAQKDWTKFGKEHKPTLPTNTIPLEEFDLKT